MTQLTLQVPISGAFNATEDVKLIADMNAIQSWSTNIDGTNLAAAAAASAGVNQGGQTVKGAVNIATSESRTNTAYGTLTTPDQVTGIVLPANGLIAVWYQATWQESVNGAASASIFLGANQLQAAFGGGNPTPQAAAINAGVGGRNVSLTTFGGGLTAVGAAGAYTGDVTTGQVVGAAGAAGDVRTYGYGPCYIFAAAGTYTLSLQFKASSGSVTASNRKLWVQALSFA